MSLGPKAFYDAQDLASGVSDPFQVETGTMVSIGVKLEDASSLSVGIEVEWSPDKSVWYPLPVPYQKTDGAAPVANCRYVHGTAVVTADGVHTAIFPWAPFPWCRLKNTLTAGSATITAHGTAK